MTWWREGTGMWRKILQLRDQSVERYCVSLSMCVSVMCTVTLHNSSSFLGHHTAWACHIELILISRNAITSEYILLHQMPISGVGGGGGKGDQFSDRCLYTTYRCRRNSEWLPWRLTTTHRSRQGNRKNIINKGTNNPNNKRNLNVPLPCLLVPCEIKTRQQQCYSSLYERERREEEEGERTLALDV